MQRHLVVWFDLYSSVVFVEIQSFKTHRKMQPHIKLSVHLPCTSAALIRLTCSSYSRFPGQKLNSLLSSMLDMFCSYSIKNHFCLDSHVLKKNRKKSPDVFMSSFFFYFSIIAVFFVCTCFFIYLLFCARSKSVTETRAKYQSSKQFQY